MRQAGTIISGQFMAWVINGNMSKKLLNKTLHTNLIFSIVVVLIAAPSFYFVTQRLYLEETDETLELKKDNFLNTFPKEFEEVDIPMWNKVNRDLKITKYNMALGEDTFFFRRYYDSLMDEDEYCRVLESPFFLDSNGYILSVKASLVESEDLQENIVWLFSVILVILLIGFYFITKILSKNLWQPFYDTLEKIEKFEIDKNSQPVLNEIKIEEFNRLNQAITKLIIKNTAIYKSQREFVENAAHELQTPLAIFQAKIDTLIQRADITEEQAEILNQINDASSRLSKLNKNLLLLSKIEGNQFAAIETVVLNEIFNKQIAFFSEQAEAKNIEIDIQLDEIVKLRSHQVLAEVLINNLFMNAIRHNNRNGLIQIKLKEGLLLFSNTGVEHPLDTNRLFQRFAKVDTSSPGNGLGLAIIRKIVAINGWKILYRFENNLHIFEISF